MDIARVTIRHIADHAGTSFKTVSRVINKQEGVSDKLRHSVERSMKELGYRPDRAAQTLRSGRNYSICILSALTTPEVHGMDVAPEFVSSIMAGALSACRKYNYQLVFDTVPSVQEQGEALTEHLRNLRCDGVILFPPHCDKPWLMDRLDALEIPYVRLVPGAQLERSACFVVDDFAAGHAIGEQFRAHGHRNIACISAPRGHFAASRRIDGFRSAFAGLSDVQIREEEGTFFFPSGFEWGTKILSQDDRPSAIFAANDTMALGVMAAARDLGLDLPSELSIAGFDDIPASRFVRPALTTIVQDMQTMSEMAAGRLIDAILARAPVATAVTTIEFALRKRESLSNISAG